jgi:hypothetical protein
MNNNAESQQLASILDDNGDFLEDHYGGVEFVMTIGRSVTPYSELMSLWVLFIV